MPAVTTVYGSEVEPGHEIKTAGRWYTVDTIHPRARADERTEYAVTATDTGGHHGHKLTLSETTCYPRRIRYAAPGRPVTTGPATPLRLAPEARARLEAAQEPGESLASATRRVLDMGLAVLPELGPRLEAAREPGETLAAAAFRIMCAGLQATAPPPVVPHDEGTSYCTALTGGCPIHDDLPRDSCPGCGVRPGRMHRTRCDNWQAAGDVWVPEPEPAGRTA